jgi:hypothetical protein
MCPGIVMVFCFVFAGWNVHLSIRVFFVWFWMIVFTANNNLKGKENWM